MPAVVNIVFALVVAGIGAATGWFLRGGSTGRRSARNRNEMRHAREVLARLQELATHVAADVGEHTSRVEEINEELLSTASHEPEAVVSVVDRLLESNHRMQQQLASADEKLQEQSRQIESHAVEARTDALTKLANRRAFDDEMAQRLAEYRRLGRVFSVIMIDVDHFKKFNDTYGHQAGDAVLAGLARILRVGAREMDLVARYGGEEFAIILPGTSVLEAGFASERIRGMVEKSPFRFENVDLHVTISMGVAEVLPAEDVSGLIRRSDAALYAAKQAGRNCVRWHDGGVIHPLGLEKPSPESGSGKDREQPGQKSNPPVQKQSQTQRKPEHSGVEPLQSQATVASAAASPETSAGPGRVEQDMQRDRAAFDTSLSDRLKQWRQGGEPPSVLLVGIDGYQQVEARYGEEAGKLAVRTVLRFLNAAMGDVGELARCDVATFAVMLADANLAATATIAERLRAVIGRCRVPMKDGQLHFTVSVSAAAAIDEDDAARLVERAEEALDAAIKSGGDCSYFHNGQWSEMGQIMPQITV